MINQGRNQFNQSFIIKYLKTQYLQKIYKWMIVLKVSYMNL